MKSKRIFNSCYLYIILCGGLILCFFIRYMYINHLYKNPIEKISIEGQNVEYKSLNLMVERSTLIDCDQIQKHMYQDIKSLNQNMAVLGECKVLIVRVKIQNLNHKSYGMSVANLVAKSGAWANGVDMGLFYQLNPSSQFNIVLGENCSTEVDIPFLLYEKHFSKDKFKNINKRDFQLILSVYPLYSAITLNLKD